jgi:hypothetical protein
MIFVVAKNFTKMSSFQFRRQAFSLVSPSSQIVILTLGGDLIKITFQNLCFFHSVLCLSQEFLYKHVKAHRELQVPQR